MKLMPRPALVRWYDRVASHAAYQPQFGHHYDRLRNHRRSWSIPFTMQVARRRAGTTRIFFNRGA